MVHNVWASPVDVARVEVLALTGEKTRQLDDFVGGLATILFTPAGRKLRSTQEWSTIPVPHFLRVVRPRLSAHVCNLLGGTVVELRTSSSREEYYNTCGHMHL
jgi:hypothetical protein